MADLFFVMTELFLIIHQTAQYFIFHTYKSKDTGPVAIKAIFDCLEVRLLYVF